MLVINRQSKCRRRFIFDKVLKYTLNNLFDIATVYPWPPSLFWSPLLKQKYQTIRPIINSINTDGIITHITRSVYWLNTISSKYELHFCNVFYHHNRFLCVLKYWLLRLCRIHETIKNVLKFQNTDEISIIKLMS